MIIPPPYFLVFRQNGNTETADSWWCLPKAFGSITEAIAEIQKEEPQELFKIMRMNPPNYLGESSDEFILEVKSLKKR